MFLCSFSTEVPSSSPPPIPADTPTPPPPSNINGKDSIENAAPSSPLVQPTRTSSETDFKKYGVVVAIDFGKYAVYTMSIIQRILRKFLINGLQLGSDTRLFRHNVLGWYHNFSPTLITMPRHLLHQLIYHFSTIIGMQLCIF